MEQLIIDEKKLYKKPLLVDTEHHESDIYIHDERTLYKILLSSGRVLREQSVYRLSQYTNPNTVLPKDLLYDEHYKFIGYSMDYLTDHQVSRDIIFGDKSFEERQKFAFRVASIIENFMNDGFVYWDIHSENIMYYKDDIKIIDMDGVRFKDDYSTDAYRFEQMSAHQSLALLCLSYMAGIEFLEFPKVLNYEQLEQLFGPLFEGTYLEGMFQDLFDYPTKLIRPTQFIMDLNEDDMAHFKTKLVRLLK